MMRILEIPIPLCIAIAMAREKDFEGENGGERVPGTLVCVYAR